MGWDPMQKIDLCDKPMKWFPGVNSLMTYGNNTEGSSVARNTYVTKYNYGIIIIKKYYCSELYL